MTPKVSICIPAYKSQEQLHKALKSCFEQDFTDFEIVITDDSPKGFLDPVISEFAHDERVRYFHNEKALGSPENWNAAQKFANGKYIKVLHHDDWFMLPTSLSRFVAMLDENAEADFAFSGVMNCDPKGNPKWAHKILAKEVGLLENDPSVLFAGNFVGAPSATIYKRSVNLEYDRALKWLVDIEFYARLLKQNPKFAYTMDLLVGITTGSGDQVTAISQNNMMVELVEQVHVFNKFRKLYKVDRYCAYQLWFLCLSHRVFTKEKLMECGVPEDQIGEDLLSFLYFNQLDAKFIHLMFLIKKLLTPTMWINRVMRRISYFVMLFKKGT